MTSFNRDLEEAIENDSVFLLVGFDGFWRGACAGHASRSQGYATFVLRTSLYPGPT